jgi:hypothetical protein
LARKSQIAVYTAKLRNNEEKSKKKQGDLQRRVDEIKGDMKTFTHMFTKAKEDLDQLGDLPPSLDDSKDFWPDLIDKIRRLENSEGHDATKAKPKDPAAAEAKWLETNLKRIEDNRDALKSEKQAALINDFSDDAYFRAMAKAVEAMQAEEAKQAAEEAKQGGDNSEEVTVDTVENILSECQKYLRELQLDHLSKDLNVEGSERETKEAKRVEFVQSIRTEFRDSTENLTEKKASAELDRNNIKKKLQDYRTILIKISLLDMAFTSHKRTKKQQEIARLEGDIQASEAKVQSLAKSPDRF